MGGNGAVPRVRVEGHLLDDLSESMDRFQQIDDQLARAIQAYRIDRTDDPLQEANVEQLQAMRDQEQDRIQRLRQQLGALRTGNAIDAQPVRSG